MRMIRIACLALVIAGAAEAQQRVTPPALTTWTGVEGTVTITFQPGWRRLDELMRKRLPGSVEPDVEIEMDHGDAIMGEPGVNCSLKLKKQPLPPGETAAAANKKIRENPALKNGMPQEKGIVRRVRFIGEAVAMETDAASGNRDDFMSWTSVIAKGDKLLQPSIICRPNVMKTGITAKDKADVQKMFDGISVSLK